MLAQAYQAEMLKRNVLSKIDNATHARIDIVASWLTDGNKPGLMLYGTVGSGKTTMGNAIAAVINAAGFSQYESERKSIAKISASELINARLSADKDKASPEMDKSAVFERLKVRDMLYIDDLGIEPTTIKSYGTELTPIIEVLLYRYEHRLMTIITSNLNDKMIYERYGERILDRINEDYAIIGYTGESYRK